MSQLVANCPRCGASKTSFDALGANLYRWQHGWQRWYELFARCRHCNRATIFVIAQRVIDSEFNDDPAILKMKSINDLFDVEAFISLKENAQHNPPENLPAEIEKAFREGATCLSVECWNAAGTMFRFAIDLATQPLLPDGDLPGLNAKTRRDLGLRLPWLLARSAIPKDLASLATVVKSGGDDGAHIGGLTREDAYDLLDFTALLLERLYTEPERVKRAAERHRQRRNP